MNTLKGKLVGWIWTIYVCNTKYCVAYHRPPPRGEADFSGVRRPKPRVARAEAQQKRVQKKGEQKEKNKETTKGKKNSFDLLGCEAKNSQGCEPKDSFVLCFPQPFSQKPKCMARHLACKEGVCEKNDFGRPDLSYAKDLVCVLHMLSSNFHI